MKRPQVGWVASAAIAIGFAMVVLPILTADRWIATLGGAHVVAGEVAPLTVRVPPFAGIETPDAGRIGGGGGVVIARGDLATRDDEFKVAELSAIAPSNTATYVAMFLFAALFAGLFSLRARRSPLGRLVRVQLVNLTLVALLAAIVKAAMLATPANVLIVPVAVLALLPALVLDRVVGLAVGALAALVVALCVPFDLGIAILLVLQAVVGGYVIGERPRKRTTALLAAGGTATALMAVAYPALQLLISGHLPLAELRDPMRSAWLAATVGPVLATVLAVVLLPLYQVLVGEITQGKLIELEDLSQPLLKQIAEKAPGSWQASLMMANLGEIAANAIGANGRLVRVGAYYHDLGKSLHPKYFIENLEPGETSPHDKLPAEASCDAIFAHVTEGIVTARKAGLHERIVDFIQTHHSGGALEHFWEKCREQGNPKGLTVEHFRYPGALPQTRETAILAICDAVEAASRTVRANAIDPLVRRIVYGKLDRGQLAESGLSITELRTICNSLGETLRHANHGRAENVAWQKSEQSASATPADSASTGSREAEGLDSLDRPAKNRPIRAATREPEEAFEDTEQVGATPKLRKAADSGAQSPIHSELATSATAPIPLLEKRMSGRESDRDIAVTDRVQRGSEREVAKAITDAADRARATAERATRDSRREADRAAMVARYANDAATRDSDPGTKEFERDEAAPSVPPPAAFSSRDGSRRVEHTKPSDGDEAAGEARGRANKRTNETEPRNRATGDFVAQMVLQPLVKDAIPSSLSDADTGRHAKQAAAKDSSKEIDLFAAEATRALQAAAPDLDVLPPSPRALSESDARNGDAPAARKRAATLPPVPGLSRPPTIQPPIRRAPTVPPFRPPTIEPVDRNVGKTLFGGAAELRPPAKREQTGPQPSLKVDTATNPAVRGIDIDASRDEAARARDDAATTQPSMAALDAARVADVDAFNRRRADVAITKPPFDAPASGDESATTQPAMPRAIADDQQDSSNNSDVGDDTQPTIDLPLPAPAFSDPVIHLDRLAAPPKPLESASAKQNTWARGLAARIDASLDDEFGRDTPTRAPSRAELQALVDSPPDATRQQSVEEIERLARDPAARRSQEELHFATPRRAFPTAEVREEDIEAAIEIVPSARRTGSIPIGIAKKKPSE